MNRIGSPEEAMIEEVRFGLVGFDAAEFGMCGIEENVVFFAEDGGGYAQGDGGVGAHPAVAGVTGRLLCRIEVPAVWKRVQFSDEAIGQFDGEQEQIRRIDIEFEVNQQLENCQGPAGRGVDERRPNGIPTAREGGGAFA